MAKPRLFSFVCAAIAAGSLAACDNEAEEPAQENVGTSQASETIELSGTLDRSFTGETVPEVTVVNPEGEELILSEVGEPMLLNLWATWCAPCVVEMPLLDELAADLDGQVRVVTVSEDMRGAEVVEPFFAERDLPNLPQWLDPQNDLAFTFGGGPVLPLTVLYDAQGNELWRVIGAYDWGSEEARAEVLDALAAGTSALDRAENAN
ncbi:TlpA family protein disulfide reductase [Aurantiacibacter poecillastricola]|uniref:TlpA family protein disulfide reductase n=1 Tax=Aurantiacibacter poecillastricola TaxID=3064385 RepID=UPI00273FA7EE|nr:TlpA disulfide reductase family protein [Aurantiacibacter sp. 219JJ12-13]MDP5261461.1 TlpA disulfide reductase family protein [Aurantiacibacter sp. 219JJ12-13]